MEILSKLAQRPTLKPTLSISRLSTYTAVLTSVAALAVPCHAAKVKILYMNWFGDAATNAVEMEIINQFNKMSKTIEVTKSATTNTDALNDKVIAMFTGGKSPDVLCVPSQNAIRYYKQNLLRNIETYIKADKFDMSQFRDGSAYFMRPELNASATYGAPWGVGILNLFYNRKSFRESGCPMPYKGWTTVDFVEAMKKMTRDTNGDGKPDTWGCEVPNIYFNGWPFIDGGEYVDANNKITVDSPAFMSALQFLADLTLKHKVTGGSFETGKTAVTMQWDSYVNKLNAMNAERKFEWSTTWLPKGKGKLISFMWGHVMAIPRGSKHPKEAWEFIKYYNSDEAQRVLARAFLYPMTKRGMAMVEKEMKAPAGIDIADVVRPYHDTGTIKTIPWWIPGFGDAYQKYLWSFSDVQSGRKSVQQWVTTFKKELEKEVNRKR